MICIIQEKIVALGQLNVTSYYEVQAMALKVWEKKGKNAMYTAQLQKVLRGWLSHDIIDLEELKT